MESKKTRRIDIMSEQEIIDYFMNNFDCYADCADVVPAMSQWRYLKAINELLKEKNNE